MSAYYNEIDPKAAAWLRELIARGLIAPGDVDERSIKEVQPDDLAGYTQCHFFAGIGVWSYALRRAGWADDGPVWTGSCPCQPFSEAGGKAEFDDDRHLWPAWFRLIRERGPCVVFGEQVAAKVGLAWIDHVSTDLEGEGYTFGAVDTCAAGFGAPHRRQRFYFVAHADGERQPRRPQSHLRAVESEQPASRRSDAMRRGAAGAVDHPADARHDDSREHGGGLSLRTARPLESGVACGMGDSEGVGRIGRPHDDDSRRGECSPGQAGPVSGWWAGAEWIACTDGKTRPVEPGTFPLAHGAPARVVRLRGYGNAINAEQAAEFIRAYLDVSGHFHSPQMRHRNG